MEQNRSLNNLSQMLIWVFRLVYLGLGLSIIFALFYIFAFQYLQGPLIGNDVPNAFIYIEWLDRYWPKIPIWWPEQGGGASFIYGHQIGSYFIILFLHRVLGFSLIQGTRLLGFFSIFLTAVGIYFFTWLKSKSQTASLLAGLFYLVSDVIWRWLFDMGLYAQSVSYMFVLPVFIFFDLFLNAYKNKQETKKRIFLFLTALFYAFLVFSHIVSGVMIGIVLPLYAFFYFQSEKWDRKRLLQIWDGLKTSALVGISGLFLLAFWVFPYIRYYSEAGRDKVTLAGIHQIPYFKIPHFFGFFLNIEEFEMWLVSMSLGVGLLFLIGLIISAFKNRSLFAWGLVATSFFLVMISPSIHPIFMKIFYQYFARIGVRGVLVTSILFPVLAGFTCVALPKLVLSFPGWVFTKLGVRLGSILTFLFKQIGNVIVFVSAILIGLTFVYFFRIPGDTKGCGKVLYVGIGPSSDYVYCKFLQDFLKGREKLPPFSLGKEEIKDGKATTELVAKIDPGVDSRVDITPSLGSLMQRWNLYTDTLQFSLYAYGLSLVRAMSGYQQWLFYGLESVNPKQIVQAAKWFGIQRVILKDGIGDRDRDNLDNYPEEYWTKVYEKPEWLAVFELKEKVNLVELSSRPTLLIIGEHQLRGYEQIFKLGNQSAFPYEDFFLVEGESRFVDDYSIAEFKQFDGLILYSHNFKNRAKAEKLLTNYVNGGGRLWIETGWQFNSPDWQTEETAAYMPLKSQNWVNLGIVSDYHLNREIIQGLDENLFGPLEWKDMGWGFSSAKNSLKDWAQPVLSVADYPLIVVGQYGQGKVVWSGMNLFAHAYDKENKEEVKLIGSLASWLLADYVPKEGKVVYTRPNPDEVNFDLKTPAKWLLWKESYSPYWQATLRTLDNKTYPLKFYRAGPGWVLIRLPDKNLEKGTVVTLRYIQSRAGYLGYVVSLLTLIGFFLYLSGLGKKIWGERKIEFIPVEKILGKIKSWWGREEE